jgi:hypothetical protein
MRISMRTIAATMLTSALVVSNALAASDGPLAAGAPAGVKHAQEEPDHTWLFLGLGAAAVIIAVAASNGGKSSSTPTTPTTQ